MKVVFIYPDTAMKLKDWKGQYYFGIGLLSSNVKRAGHETTLIHITKKITKTQLLNKLSRVITPNSIIAMSATSHMFHYAIKLSKWIKKEFKIPILCGGIHPTLNAEEAINFKQIDMICVGEGEETLVELCNKLDKKKDITNIKGLWVKKGGKIYKNPVRNLIGNLDDLPFADRDIFDYKNMYWEKEGIGNFMASKGCPFNCSYCCNHSLAKHYRGKGKYVRFRSVKSIIKEIKEVTGKYKFIKNVLFDDDIFGMSKEWLKEFSEKYRKDIGLPLICNFRATLLDEENIKLLKKAGCVKLKIGVESGNDFILDKVMNRNMTKKQIIDAFDLCKKYDIKTHSFNMVGIPYENVDRILDTIKLNALLKPDSMQISIFHPFEGTKIYKLCKKEGFLTGKTTTNFYKDSVCNYPNLTNHQIRMFCYYFRELTRIYSFLNDRKGNLSNTSKAILDYLLKMKITAYFSLMMYNPLRTIKRLTKRKAAFAT